MDMVGQSKMPPNDYTRQWRRYKTFKKLRFFALLGWIPLIAAYIVIYRTFGFFEPALLGVYLLMTYVGGILLAVWPCPRCGQSFSDPWRFALRGGGYRQGIAPACVHCGLARFAADDSGITRCVNCRSVVAGRFCTTCGAAVNADTGTALGGPTPLCPKCKNPVAGRFCTTCGVAMNADNRSAPARPTRASRELD